MKVCVDSEYGKLDTVLVSSPKNYIKVENSVNPQAAFYKKDQ